MSYKSVVRGSLIGILGAAVKREMICLQYDSILVLICPFCNNTSSNIFIRQGTLGRESYQTGVQFVSV